MSTQQVQPNETTHVPSDGTTIPAVTARLLQKLVALAQRAVAELEARFETAIAEGKPLPIRELTQALAALERTLKLHTLLEKANAPTPTPQAAKSNNTDHVPKVQPTTRTAPPRPPNQPAANIARMCSPTPEKTSILSIPRNTSNGPRSAVHL